MNTKGEMKSKGEHEFLSSMKKGDIVDEIVIEANMDLQWPHRIINANMDLQWPHRMSLMPLSPTTSSLDPLQSGFVP